MSTGKEAILGRIREALKLTAPFPGSHGEESHDHGHAKDHTPGPTSQPASFRAWLPLVGPSYEERVELFAKNSADLKTSFVRCASKEKAIQALKELAQIESWKSVAYHRAPLAAEVTNALGLQTLVTDAGYDVNALERCDAGISICDSLIAQTGSIMLTTTSAGGRALTVLPPHHICLATREQLLPDLAAGYEDLRVKYGTKLPSFSTVITGPSRTGDIERILVLGAHGPKRLTVLLIE